MEEETTTTPEQETAEPTEQNAPPENACLACEG